MQVLELDGAPANLTAIALEQPIFSQAPSPNPPMDMHSIKALH